MTYLQLQSGVLSKPRLVQVKVNHEVQLTYEMAEFVSLYTIFNTVYTAKYSMETDQVGFCTLATISCYNTTYPKSSLLFFRFRRKGLIEGYMVSISTCTSLKQILISFIYKINEGLVSVMQ